MKSSFYFYANPYQPKSAEAARELAQALQARGGTVYTERWLSDAGAGGERPLQEVLGDIGALVAFGGDGTLLRASQLVMGRRIPLLGVHTGTVGFLMRGRADEAQKLADLLIRGEYVLDEYPVLEIGYDGKKYYALNDLALTRGEHPGVIEVTALADGETVFCANGDGAVISTPVGSTAYGLSAGGPVVRHDADCLIVTPLCARELLLRPVVLPLAAGISLKAHGRERRRLQLAIDGQILLPVTHEAQVEVSAAPFRVPMIRPERLGFFDILRKKQAVWNQQEIQE